MPCSSLQLYSPTLLPCPPQLLHGSWWAGGQDWERHQLSRSISHLCAKPHMTAVGCQLWPVVGYQEQFTQLLVILYGQCEASVLHSFGSKEWKWFCCVLRFTVWWISCILRDTYCGVHWSLQCHSDEQVAQTVWQFQCPFLWRRSLLHPHSMCCSSRAGSVDVSLRICLLHTKALGLTSPPLAKLKIATVKINLSALKGCYK